MKRASLALSVLLLSTPLWAEAAIAQADSRLPALQGVTTANWAVEVVTDALDYPWDIARSGDRIIVTEKAGNVVMLEGARLSRFKLETSEPIANESGAGLLGMALASDFAESGLAFFYHSYRSNGRLMNKVIQARFDGQAWRESRLMLTGIPGHPLYNGGRIAIGPDGHLYVTTGWTEDRGVPQDRKSLAGKVLRMTLSGEVPSDNPFPVSYIYSYGHRNPQGLAWGPTGELFVAEHGQAARDEINIITPGKNYGWPLVQGDQQREGMQAPFVQSGNVTWAPSGIAFAGSDLLVTALATRGLYLLSPNTRALELIFSSGDRLRMVMPAGDYLYLITTNRSPRGEGPSRDRLLKLSLNNPALPASSR